MNNLQPHDRAINVLQVRRLGIDTYYEPVVFMRARLRDLPLRRL